MKRFVDKLGKKLGYYKDFDGLRFKRLDTAYKHKADAEIVANRYRAKGYYARIDKQLVSIFGLYITSWVRDLDYEYAVWIRKK